MNEHASPRNDQLVIKYNENLKMTPEYQLDKFYLLLLAVLNIFIIDIKVKLTKINRSVGYRILLQLF
jgi:hypothetical protein